MSKINKVVVKGVSYDIEDAYARKDIQQNTIKIGKEAERAAKAEGEIKSKAVDAGTLEFQTRANEVALKYKTIDETSDEITIPTATTEKAGVMSAEDKVAVNNAAITVDGEKKLAIADSEGNVIIEFDGHIKTKYFDSRNIPSVDVNNDFFAISDESGNIILILQNGHIKTQHFDSANGVSAVIEEKNNKNILYL